MLFRKKQKANTPPPRAPRAEQQLGNPVFSYYSSRDPLHERSAAVDGDKDTGVSKWRYALSFIILLAGIGGALYLSTLTTDSRIIVQDQNTATLHRDPGAYGQVANELLAESVLNRSKLTIDTAGLSRKLQEQFPEIHSVTIIVPIIGRRPVMSVTPAVPSFILSTNGDRYVLDRSGRSVMAVNETHGVTVPQLPMVQDESGLIVEVGKSVLPKQTIDYIGTVLAHLEAKQLEPEALTLPALANELHVRIKGQPYFVKFNTAGDPLAAVGTFLAVKQRLEKDGQLPGEYIDVRVDERAYYK